MMANRKKNDFNIYAKWNYEISPPLNVFVDIQYRKVGYQTAGTDVYLIPYDINESFNFFNPKAGLSYTLSENDMVYSSFAIANREPARVDYLSSPVKPKPERLNNIEAGWRRNTDTYKLEANYYLMHYTDQLVLTGELDNVGNPIRANVGKSYRTGMELSGTIKLLDKLTWSANATWSKNENKEYVIDENNLTQKKNTAIALSPNWIAGSQLNWNAFKNFEATILSKYVSQQFLDNTEIESLTLESYLVNDLRLNYSLTPKGLNGIEVSLLVNNIFDVEYSSNGATYGDGTPYYYPQAGVNFLAMVMLKF